MQYKDKKSYFISVVGEVIKELRMKQTNSSLSNFANEYDIDKSALSKIERGLHSSEFFNIWKIIEALDIDFKDFVVLLQNKLGKNFKIKDE